MVSMFFSSNRELESEHERESFMTKKQSLKRSSSSFCMFPVRDAEWPVSILLEDQDRLGQPRDEENQGGRLQAGGRALEIRQQPGQEPHQGNTRLSLVNSPNTLL